jgi:hypothetical protein
VAVATFAFQSDSGFCCRWRFSRRHSLPPWQLVVRTAVLTTIREMHHMLKEIPSESKHMSDLAEQ